MACSRNISTKVIYLRKRFHPSFSCILHDDDGKSRPSVANSLQPTISHLLQRGTAAGFCTLRQERRFDSFNLPPGLGSSFCRHMSSAIAESSDKIEYVGDIANVTEEGVQVAVTQAPVVNEVAIAAADSFYPVAALQYFIDDIHSFTGFNWWISIALATVLIRGVATVPLLIYKLKATLKLTGMDPKAVAKAQERMQASFKQYRVIRYTRFIKSSIVISFYCAITNMVEKVPSFKAGGAFWFTDLTTPDSFYIFPELTALTTLLIMNCDVRAGSRSTLVRILSVLFPLSMSFLPQAMFCHWVTSNLFTLMYELVLRPSAVEGFLGLHKLLVAATPAPQPGSYFPFKYSSAEVSEPSPSPIKLLESLGRRKSSSSVICQRLESLEKQVKGKM